jgi:hypothetical protein
LERGQGAHLEMEAQDDLESRWISGDGGIDGIEGPVSAISLQGVTFASDSCASEPAGAISLADEQGRWATLDYGEDCDGCGRIVIGDTDLGAFCWDATPLTEWSTPW